MKVQFLLRLVTALMMSSMLAPVSAQTNDGTPSASLSFGRIMFDEQIEQEIALSNPTNHQVTVANIQLTAPLLAHDIQTVIEPGENLRFVLAMGMERLFGDYEGSIKINFEEEVVDPIVLSIKGYIVPPIELKPAPAFYVVTSRGSNKNAFIEIINHRKQPLNIKRAYSDSDRFKTNLETISAGEHYRLELLLDGNAPIGEKTEKIMLETDQGSGGSMFIQANTIIREHIYTAPNAIDMGALPMHVASDEAAVTSLAQILMVYRPDTTDFRAEARTDLDYIDLQSERGPNKDRYQLTLTLIPGKVVPGKIEGVVRIWTNDDTIRTLEIPISGHILE